MPERIPEQTVAKNSRLWNRRMSRSSGVVHYGDMELAQMRPAFSAVFVCNMWVKFGFQYGNSNTWLHLQRTALPFLDQSHT